MKSYAAVCFLMAIFSATSGSTNVIPSETSVGKSQEQEVTIPVGAISHEMKSNAVETKDKGCTRVDMMVNMTNIPWFSALLSPVIFNVYRCKGSCRYSDFPPERLNTNVWVRNTLQNKAPELNIPGACCVPIKKGPKSFLYKDAGGTFKYREFRDVIVEECGCV